MFGIDSSIERQSESTVNHQPSASVMGLEVQGNLGEMGLDEGAVSNVSPDSVDLAEVPTFHSSSVSDYPDFYPPINDGFIAFNDSYINNMHQYDSMLTSANYDETVGARVHFAASGNVLMDNFTF